MRPFLRAGGNIKRGKQKREAALTQMYVNAAPFCTIAEEDSRLRPVFCDDDAEQPPVVSLPRRSR